MRPILLTIIIAALGVNRVDGLAQRGDAPAGWLAIRVDDLHCTTTGSVETAAVFGRRAQAELFATAIRFPPHTKRTVHSHRALRYAVVLSGTSITDTATSSTRRRLEKRTSGTFFTEPANVTALRCDAGRAGDLVFRWHGA